MLSENRRSQLDTIVQQMVRNKETDNDIQWVVNDFKKKYENENKMVDNRSMFEKIGDTTGKVLDTASQAIFGTFGKTTGGLITQGIASGAQLLGQVTGKKDIEQYGQRLERQLGTKGFEAKPTDIAFQTLEMYPGGGKVGEFVSKLPGGKQVMSGLNNIIDKIPSNLRADAVKQFSEALGATTKEMKALTGKVVPELLDKKVTATSLQKLSQKAIGEASVAGENIDKFIEALPETTKMKVQPILDALEKTKREFIIDGVQIEPQIIKTADELKSVIAQFGEDVSPKSLRAVRQIWDKTVAKSGGFIGKTLKEGSEIDLKKTATNAIREELAKEFPELSKLNAEFSLWKNVEKITKATLERKSTQGKGLSQVITTVAGGATGASQGNTITERVKNAAVGALIGKFAGTFNSSGYKMISASTKNKLAEIIASGNIKNIGFALSKLTNMVKNATN